MFRPGNKYNCYNSAELVAGASWLQIKNDPFVYV